MLKVGDFPHDTGWSVRFIFVYQTLSHHLW